MHRLDTPRILIARMSAVGDAILTLPVACALRTRFPQAFIGWVVERNASSVVVGHGCIDEVIVLERSWFTSPRGVYRASRRLRPLGFNISVDCQGMTKSALACRLSGATHRIGFSGRYGSELSPWLNNELVQPELPHVTDRSLELLQPLGIVKPEVRWNLPIDPVSRQKMRQAINCMGLEGRDAVLNPGATWPSKLWEMDRFAAVARYLGQSAGLKSVVVWGGQRELAWAEEIVTAAEGHAVLAPRTSLIELAALISNGRVFVASDTGPLHMAVAVGTPSVGLYGATRPQDCGPYGAPHVALQVAYQTGSRKERRRADNHAMRLITAEMACEACDQLLQRDQRANHRGAA